MEDEVKKLLDGATLLVEISNEDDKTFTKTMFLNSIREAQHFLKTMKSETEKNKNKFQYTRY